MATDFNTLLQRAERRTQGRNRQPYVLKVEGDEDIVIKYPDALKQMEYERADTVYGQLQILTGPEFPRLLDLFRGKDISVVQLLITELWEQWNDDSAAVPGGKEA